MCKEVVRAVCKIHASHVNTARAYENLRAKFPTWELSRDAPHSDVVRAIRSAGLANTKAPRIQAILQQLTRE